METIHQCPQCNSQGEIMMDEQRSKSIETQRLTLESVLVKELNGIIKKLNGEIEVLESKLKEKEGVVNEKSDVGSTREEVRG